jgi:hypothetical protein
MDQLWLAFDNYCFVLQNVLKMVLKIRRLSCEQWWAGSPVAVFENKNQWETTEILGWFSPRQFGSIIKKLPVPLREDAL